MSGPEWTESETDETIVHFGDRILVRDCGVEIWFDYSEITSVMILDSFSVLRVEQGNSI